MKSLMEITALATVASYNDEGKNTYKKAGLAWVRELAKNLNLARDTYDIRYNAGGTAVSGEVILHHEKFYLCLNEMGAYWRLCDSRKDYTGKMNHWLFGFGQNIANDDIVTTINKQIVHLAGSTVLSCKFCDQTFPSIEAIAYHEKTVHRAGVAQPAGS